MKDFIITCSSTCDLSPYFLRKHNVYYVSFFYYLNDNRYYDDFYKEHDINDFYNTIKTQDVKTSQPDPNQYKELWFKLIDQGYDILHIELSSGISGAVNSALIAKSMACDIKKDAKIEVVDSLCCSTGYGMLVSKACEQKAMGKSLDEVKEYCEKTRSNINHIFAVTNLDTLIKGGRVSKVAGTVGKMLNIIPIMHVNNDGRLEQVKKARGFNNAIDEIINLSKTNIANGEDYNDILYFTNSNSKDLCAKLQARVKETYKNARFDDEYDFNVGTVIGAHTGEGAIAIFYIGDKRV